MQDPFTSGKPRLLLFDVYETLLDMQPVKRRINLLLDSKRGYQHWLGLLTQYSMVNNCTGLFHPFAAVAKAALQMAGSNYGKTIDAEEAANVVYLLGHLPVNDGVPGLLSRLTDAGFRLAALTNAPKTIIDSRMERTGLVSYFEKIMSAGEIKKSKPAVEVYQWALKQLETKKEEALYISTHDWDVTGAMQAGIKSAYIQQSETLFYPLAEQPALSFPDFAELVQRLTATDLR